MEFNQKLQILRKQRNLTQEELADSLYVSRTAISKWESGRGYPNIESLKSIAKFFDVTIDELLSSDELLTSAETDTRSKGNQLCDFVFGLLDYGLAFSFFLPVFRQNANGNIDAVSVLSLAKISGYFRTVCFVLLICFVLMGTITLALQNLHNGEKTKCKLSLVLNGTAVLIFIMTLQPYAASLFFFILLIKVILFQKKQ